MSWVLGFKPKKNRLNYTFSIIKCVTLFKGFPYQKLGILFNTEKINQTRNVLPGDQRVLLSIHYNFTPLSKVGLFFSVLKSNTGCCLFVFFFIIRTNSNCFGTIVYKVGNWNIQRTCSKQKSLNYHSLALKRINKTAVPFYFSTTTLQIPYWMPAISKMGKISVDLIF